MTQLELKKETIFRARKSRIRAHMLRQHPAKQHVKVKCTICNKEKGNQILLAQHMKMVHSEKRHACTLCDKAFSHAKALKVIFDKMLTGYRLNNGKYSENVGTYCVSHWRRFVRLSVLRQNIQIECEYVQT